MEEPLQLKPTASIYQNETVYRPMTEKDSALLEVELGCSYGRCSFCDFIKDEFRILPLTKIKENTKILGQREPEKTSLFLLGQNAMCLKTNMLLEICAYVREFMPAIQEINLYGRADDINRKTIDELAALKAAGISSIHVGVESGSDRVLQYMNKGVSRTDLLMAFKALETVGLYYHITYILGLGGRTYWRDHVQETASLFNEIHPLTIWALALVLWPDTPLHKEAQAGRFMHLNYEQMLAEERLILSRMTTKNECLYTDTTALGKYTLIGMLPKDHEKLLKAADALLAPFSLEGFLDAP